MDAPQPNTPAPERVSAGPRLSLDEAVALQDAGDLLALGQLAVVRRRALHGDDAYYIANLHINLSNLCVNRCRFCAFRRQAGAPDAYERTAEEIWEYAERMAPPGAREFHLVSGLSPNLTLAFHERVLRGLRERFPQVHLKSMTAVEIDHQATLNDIPIQAVLERLTAAGLDSLTGGGAETLNPRVRGLVCPEKLDGAGYLDIHRQAHRMGLRTTATLLFGHIETPRERLEHLIALRELQDETGGFTAFVPLVFHPANTELAHLRRATARQILEMLALARIVLDNFAHIKAYWVSLAPKLAQIALAWGADDLDGTVAHENIHHEAGATSPQGMTFEELRALIREAGFRPVERDALYRPVNDADTGNTPPSIPERPAEPGGTPNLDCGAIAAGETRLTPDDAERLLKEGDLLELAQAANAMRTRLHPEGLVTYAVDRNINTTNRCESLCDFCAFARDLDDTEGWTLDRVTIAEKLDDLCDVSDSLQNEAEMKSFRPPPIVLMQGGMSPDLDLAWYEDLFRWMRKRWPNLHIHALSPPEIKFLAQGAAIGWREAIERLHDAGLHSIPGGGAEILSDRMRGDVSPGKCGADEWIGIMRTAHEAGLRTSATMVIGLGETIAERVEHLERLRTLQDETGGFTAFIPWTFQSRHTRLGKRMAETGQTSGAGAWDYLRTLAVARLYLDNIDNIQASWVTQGRDIAQVALLCGANDLGSTMLEENVVAAAGTTFRMGPKEFAELAQDLGLRLARRDFFYRVAEQKTSGSDGLA